MCDPPCSSSVIRHATTVFLWISKPAHRWYITCMTVSPVGRLSARSAAVNLGCSAISHACSPLEAASLGASRGSGSGSFSDLTYQTGIDLCGISPLSLPCFHSFVVPQATWLAPPIIHVNDLPSSLFDRTLAPGEQRISRQETTEHKR